MLKVTAGFVACLSDRDYIHFRGKSDKFPAVAGYGSTSITLRCLFG